MYSRDDLIRAAVSWLARDTHEAGVRRKIWFAILCPRWKAIQVLTGIVDVPDLRYLPFVEHAWELSLTEDGLDEHLGDLASLLPNRPCDPRELLNAFGRKGARLDNVRFKLQSLQRDDFFDVIGFPDPDELRSFKRFGGSGLTVKVECQIGGEFFKFDSGVDELSETAIALNVKTLIPAPGRLKVTRVEIDYVGVKTIQVAGIGREMTKSLSAEEGADRMFGVILDPETVGVEYRKLLKVLPETAGRK